jgi:integral membrane sensor domain MASE1
MRVTCLLHILALALVYFVTAVFGFSLNSYSQIATLIWPAAGISLAAILIWGSRLWPAIFLGAFAVHLWLSETVWIAMGIAVGNTVEALIGALILKRLLGFHNSLDRVKDVFVFIGVAAAFSTIIMCALEGAWTL